MNTRIVLLILVILVAAVGIYQMYGSVQEKSSSFVIKNASITYDTRLQSYVLDFYIINTGDKPVLIDSVWVYKDTVSLHNLVGGAVFVKDITDESVYNKLIILYGSNPIPPKYETRFRAIHFVQHSFCLDRYSRLKPGTYIIEVRTKDGTKVFYSISFEKKSVSMSVVDYTLVKLQVPYYKLKVHLRIKNTGEIPIFIPDDVKVYLDGESLNTYSNGRVILPHQTEDIEINTTPVALIPCNDITNCAHYIEDSQIINLGLSENVPSMLKSHKVTIVVANSKVNVIIPSLEMSGRIIDIKVKPRTDATGKVWVNLESIKLRVNYSWITTLDAGWFNRVTICVNNLCEKFTPLKIDAKAINANEYIVELKSAGTYPAEKGNKVKVLVYYGDILVTQTDLT